MAQLAASGKQAMTEKHGHVFLFDVDNTLLNNDQVVWDLRRHLSSYFSPLVRDRFFQIFEELRREIGYARLPGGPRTIPARGLVRSKGAQDVPLAG
jgi:FMN phosphatase YigB (HAD superfamily)